MESARGISYQKKGKGTIINLEQGKLPPQALDLEEAVLGAMMVDKKGVDDVIDILHAEAFYNPKRTGTFRKRKTGQNFGWAPSRLI